MNFEYYSSLALVASVVVYVVAMFLHAAEWAAARRVAVEPAAVEQELVSVGSTTLPDERPEPAEGIDSLPPGGGNLPRLRHLDQLGRGAGTDTDQFRLDHGDPTGRCPLCRV